MEFYYERRPPVPGPRRPYAKLHPEDLEFIATCVLALVYALRPESVWARESDPAHCPCWLVTVRLQELIDSRLAT